MILPLLPVAGLAIAGVAKVVGTAATLAVQAGSAALAAGKQAASSVISGGKGVATDLFENAASNALTSNRSKETSPEPGGNKGMTLHQEKIKKCGVECTRYIIKAENRCEEVKEAGKTGANEELSQTSSYSGPQHP